MDRRVHSLCWEMAVAGGELPRDRRGVGAVTARVTTLKGADAGAYYVEALPSYYLDAGEPKGVWHGRGAERLGLEGEVVNGEFLRVMAGQHPHARVGVHLGRRFGDESVRGFDVTASAPKSVSTLFAIGDDRTRAVVLAAHDTAVGVMVDWIEAHAHTRYRIGGEVAVVDSRPAKPHGVAADTLHDRWDDRVRGLGLEPRRVVGQATGWVRARELGADDIRAVMLPKPSRRWL